MSCQAPHRLPLLNRRFLQPSLSEVVMTVDHAAEAIGSHRSPIAVIGSE